MTKDWVDQKNKEYWEQYEKHVEFIKQEILNIKWIDDAEVLQKILKLFMEKDWNELKWELQWLHYKIPIPSLDVYEEEKRKYFETVIECKEWFKSLDLDKLVKLQIYEDITGYETPYDRYLDTEKNFDGDIIITDPCCIIKESDRDDWEKCEYGSNMEILGIHHYMTRDTLYGDWSCITYDLNSGKEIGEFCADAGLVSVLLLDEVLEYNPEYNDHLTGSWSVTWIKNFKGTVYFKVHERYHEYEVEVEGHGVNKVTGEPIDFVGKQSGF